MIRVVMSTLAFLGLLIFLFLGLRATVSPGIRFPGEIPQYWNKQTERTVVIIGHDPSMTGPWKGCILPDRGIKARPIHWYIMTFRDKKDYEAASTDVVKGYIPYMKPE